jgi:hypothetical protein
MVKSQPAREPAGSGNSDLREHSRKASGNGLPRPSGSLGAREQLDQRRTHGLPCPERRSRV